MLRQLSIGCWWEVKMGASNSPNSKKNDAGRNSNTNMKIREKWIGDKTATRISVCLGLFCCYAQFLAAVNTFVSLLVRIFESSRVESSRIGCRQQKHIDAIRKKTQQPEPIKHNPTNDR